MASVVGHQPPPFFRRGPARVAQLLFFVVVCLVLLGVDMRFRYLEVVRQVVATVTYPMQVAAFTPVHVASEGLGYFTTLASVKHENEQMRRRQVEAAATVLRSGQLEQENQRLRALLAMKERQPVPSTVADILYAARDPFSRKVVIDKGATHGTVPGQPVVDDAGVIGQVTRVFPMLSEVTLISDKDQAVPVQVARNGLRSVVFGAGAGLLEMKFMATNVDVREGDVLVTSGLDGVFVQGLPVARVTRVERDSAYTFARIVAAPVGAVERGGAVLLLGRPEPLPAVPEAEPEQDQAKAKRPRRLKD